MKEKRLLFAILDARDLKDLHSVVIVISRIKEKERILFSRKVKRDALAGTLVDYKFA